MDRRVKERLIGATILVVLVVLIVPELLSGPKRLSSAPSPAAGHPVRNITVDLATSKATAAEETAAASAAPSGGAPSSTTAATPGEAKSGDTTYGETAGAGAGQPAVGAPPSAQGAHGGPEHAVAAPPTITTLRAQEPARRLLEKEAPPPRSAPLTSKSEGAPTGTTHTTAAVREPAAVETSRHNWAVQVGSFESHANAEKLVRQLKAHESSVYVSSSGQGPSLRYRVRIGPLADRSAAERVRLKLRKEGRSSSLVPP